MEHEDLEIIDVELTLGELESLVDYYDLDMPEIVDEVYPFIKIMCPYSFKKWLDRDNVNYWRDGELIVKVG